MSDDAELTGEVLAVAVHLALHPRHNIEIVGGKAFYCAGDHHRSEGCELLPVPDYPGDIAAAWQVVEHLKAQRKPASIICRTGCFEDFDEFGWEVTFRRAPVGYAFDKHLPTAICRAALAAVRSAKESAGC